MKRYRKHLSGKTAGFLLLFMTLLMGFPFFFYYRYSVLESDVSTCNRLRIGKFGSEIRSSFETIPPDSLSRETVISLFNRMPLIADLKVELYDEAGNPVAERSSESIEYKTGDPRLYRALKKIIDPVRNLFIESKEKHPEEIKERLREKALDGNRGIDYIFKSGEAGDRILYFSYPLRLFTENGPEVKGVLFIEYTDRSAKAILQKQRNQFALMCLLFLILLCSYLLFILTAFVFPLARLSRKLMAVKNRTEYLLPHDRKLKENSEIGEIIRQIDSIAELQNNREREMEEYISELKHIIRNPLTIIRVSLEGLLMGRNSEREMALSRIIGNNLYRIESYIGSYNPLPELLKSEKPPEDIGIRRFLEEIITNYASLAERKQVRFKLQETGSDIVWRGFRAPLSFVCEQIISNAVDFSPADGTITVGASGSDGSIVLFISDQGPGIPEGKEKDIFRQYASYRNKAKDNHTGTGLYVSRKVLQKIGGEISAVNNKEKGAVFTITLPVRV